VVRKIELNGGCFLIILKILSFTCNREDEKLQSDKGQN